MVHPPLMAHRRALAGISALLALATLAVGCDEDAGGRGHGPDLESTWMAQPIQVGSEIAGAADRACRANDAGLIPLTSTAVVADVRGGGRIAVVFSGPREQVFLCLLVASNDGTMSWSTGWGGSRHSAEGPLSRGEIRPEEPQAAGADPASSAAGGGAADSAGGSAGAITTATGRVGRLVAAADLMLASGLRVRATTAAGWYAAWWPSDDRVAGYQAIDASGQPLGPVQH